MDSKSKMTVISFAVSLAILALLLQSIYMAVGFIILLFVHEMGHYVAAKHKGLKVSPPVFMGPMGAFINMEEQPANARVEAYMAFAGPLAGTIGSIIATIVGLKLGSPELLQVAQWSFWLNLFNLIPLAPLDGGRVSMAIDRRMWVLWVPLLAYVIFTMPLGGFGLIVVFLIATSAWRDIQMRKAMAAQFPSYFDVGFGTRVGYATAYLALAAFLFWVLNVPGGLVGLLVSLGL
jgi:Zn-dependent protease